MSEDKRLSYSSATLLKNCSQKYYYYKIAGVQRDPDAEENMEAFNVGKAFHQVLEDTGHTEEALEDKLEAACKAFEVDEFKGMIHAMLLRYLQVHQKSELNVVKCEFEITNEYFIGFVDALMVGPDGKWWIVDLKTASRATETTFARLHKDTQLNLYSYFARDIATYYKLDFSDFGGARYRVTTKSKLTRKATESYGAHVKRTAKNVKSYDIIIPVERMEPQKFYSDHLDLYAYAESLRSGVSPRQNRSYCDSFFRPCEYWSQCHGDTYTKCKSALEVIGSDNV